MDMPTEYQFFLAIAKNVSLSEQERQEAIEVLAEIGDRAILDDLKTIYAQPATENFRVVVLHAIGEMTIRLIAEEKSHGKNEH